MTTMNGLARLAFVAEQFGYEYADLLQTEDNKFALFIVPDPNPRARERAARNRERYPDAGDGVSLPPAVPEEIELLKARMMVDLGSQFTDKLRMALAVFVFTAFAAAIGFRLRAETVAVVIVGIVWAVLMGLLPVALGYSRQHRAGYAARLQAAGFTPVTDRNGRLRYVPPGRQLPGHGNPFAGGA
ncbi:hypothetical protein [Streptomyces soliscabiei]|uniref:hypothetical protein n=1 Tax=Streptomyces soliscabiei TaxID=588897 RepID=UPI0029BE9522|nr:hypothetical protein [Streptomyces sp. NY05-11A]MDX2679349.1 hypothetical protein [Streptomyces sp. NY05-11A]